MSLNPTQRIAAKHLYGLISAMDPGQRQAVALVLTSLGLMTEDGFLGGDGTDDFYALCFDVLAGTSLAMRMLTGDGVVPATTGEIVQLNDQRAAVFQLEADLALQRLERQLALIPAIDPTKN
jgi:hypothetical protein